MQRILLAIAGAAAFCAAVTLLLQMAIARGLPATSIVLVTSSATLLLALGAAAYAFRAFKRSSLVAVELERLTRSMDAAIKDLSLRADREAAKFEELQAAVSGRQDSRAGPAAPAEEEFRAEAPAEARPADLGPPVPPRKAKSAPAASAQPDVLDAPGAEAALRRMMTVGQAELSLQPIIAAGRGEAGGFEVHFRLEPDDGKPIDIRRLHRVVPEADLAAYERLAVVSATEAARRRVGDISDRMPLHVAVSSALLEDGLEFSTVLDIFKLHPALATSVVMSLPAETFESDRHAGALELLAGLQIRLAAEDWQGSQGSLDRLRKAGVAVVKVPADRLLDRIRQRKGVPDGNGLVAMATGEGLDIVATDVRSEADAVSLIDMGVDLMTGDKLAAPRRLKSQFAGTRA